MSSEFTTRDRDGKGSVSVHWEAQDRWIVVLSGPGVTARRNVCSYAPHGRLDRLFMEMAAAWRNWDGEKAWHSLEHELKLSCTSDGLGHVRIAVELSTDPMQEWRAAGTIVVEAGQLKALAKNATEFCEEGLPRPM